MHHPQHSATLPDLQSALEPSSAFLTQCHRHAFDRLSKSFREKLPLAILIGDGKATSNFVIRKFLSRLDPDVAVARVTGPCANAVEFMGRIIAAVGFKPKDMSADDLESIFSLFLSFQRGHHRRTVVCIEQAQDCDKWVLEKICHFVEMERVGGFGMMVILSGQTGLKELLNSRPLSSISSLAGNRISLAPFKLTETREYIRQRVQAAGIANIEEAFEYHSIHLIHELCAGVPDAIGTLVRQCRELVDEEGSNRVTKDIVKRAYERIREASEQDDARAEGSTAKMMEIRPPFGRLIFELSGNDVKELAVRKGHILIGRSALCDIYIDSPIVSRHHALISHTSEGDTIVDLGSTNGTLVDGCSIKEHILVAGETITVGDSQIEYVFDDEVQRPSQNAENDERIESSGTAVDHS
jgi:pSer/pThr/pTyr-binding forkhead associated (FHA) protein